MTADEAAPAPDDTPAGNITAAIIAADAHNRVFDLIKHNEVTTWTDAIGITETAVRAVVDSPDGRAALRAALGHTDCVPARKGERNDPPH